MFLFAALTLFISFVASHNHPAKSCKEYILPITTNTINYIWGLPELQNNYDLTTFNTNLGRWDANTTLNPISGIGPATGNYKISGTFCSPTISGSGTVLIATHGFGFDRSYWDPELQHEKYSFVDHAISKGHSVFFYDRLGISKSSVISGYVNQLPIQAAILSDIITQIRAGRFSSKPKHIVLVGHSFGSVVSNTLIRDNPNSVDAVILTGIGYSVPSTATSFEAWQPRIARIQSPGRWRQLDSGYVTWVDIFANINTFFKAPFYDQLVVEYADANKQPFGLMEIVSLSIANLTAPTFKGPVLVISGANDFIFCTGNCERGVLEPEARKRFGASRDMEVYIQPGSGHGINLSLNATGAFEVITSFLNKNGY